MATGCVLLVTECGMGTRVPLSSKRIGLSRKGGKGKKAIKLMDNDSIAAACVVSSRSAEPPQVPQVAWQLYSRDHAEASEETFIQLPEEQRSPYQEEASELHRRYEEALDTFRKQDCEELLLGCCSGAVTRIKVSSVPVTARMNRG
ncbi:unnamed protein product, partial [Effrenium voratum]